MFKREAAETVKQISETFRVGCKLLLYRLCNGFKYSSSNEINRKKCQNCAYSFAYK